METNDVPLAEKVRRRLDSGALPRERPLKLWAGYGRGNVCCVCDKRLLYAHLVYECDVNEQTCRFHLGCYGLWTGELIRRGLYKPEKRVPSE